MGAGTSGRLGVLEAAECPPTFGTPPALVQAVMAGGRSSVFRAREGAEDDAADGARQVRRRARRGRRGGGRGGERRDALRARGARGGAAARRRHGAGDVQSRRSRAGGAGGGARLAVGPEILAGSTRLKAGTATKLALNTLTTAVFVRLGKVYGNRMVDLLPRSAKLRARAAALVVELGRVTPGDAQRLLAAAGGRAKLAIVMARLGVDRREAARRLAAADEFLGRALEP